MIKIRLRQLLYRIQWQDIGYLSAMLAAASLPLIVFRPQNGLFGEQFLPLFADAQGNLTARYTLWLLAWFLVGICLAVFWNRFALRCDPPSYSHSRKSDKQPNFIRILSY